MKEKIIEILSKGDNTSLTAFEINDLLGLKTTSEFSELIGVLDEMCEDAILYHSNKDKYLLFENSHLIKGKLQLKEKGFGFIVGTNLAHDIHVSKENINGALNDDIVAVEMLDKNLYEGRIVRILKRDDKTIVGEVVVENGNYYVIPDKKSIPRLGVVKGYTIGAVEGHKVAVKRTSASYCEIIAIIGHKNDVNIDMLSIVYEHDFRPDFPEEVISALDQIPDSVSDSEVKGRLDLRDQVIFTIDGADTKDIDDAVSIKKNDDGTYELGVHIANVSYYVKKDGAIDNEAYARGTSVYLTDRVLPMLPHKLSNGICSLNPNEDRLAKSCIMIIDNKGEVISSTITNSVIRSRKKMTYDAVNSILEDNIIPDGYEEFADDLYLMNELSDILRKKMIRRGYIDFDTSEVKIIVDENNHPIDIKLREQRTGEKLIENFMIVANETVAEYIYNLELPGIYRVHDKPNEKKIDTFFNFLAARGMTVKGKRHGDKLTVKNFQNILSQIADDPASSVIKDLLVRSMAKAVYSNINIGHFGLGSKCYSHFTSPIRRYPDLILHRLLDDYMHGYDENVISKWARELPAMCEHCSTKERDADNCEYDVEDMKMAEYMEDHIGEEYNGIISGVQRFGIFVTLSNMVEGLVKIEDLPHDTYSYNEDILCLMGKNKNHRYMFGDTVRVKVIGASKETKNIDFELIEGVVKDEKKKKEIKNKD